MFTLKNFETNTVTTFRPWKDGVKNTLASKPRFASFAVSKTELVFVEQVHGGDLGIQADMLADEARDFWKTCVKNGAKRVK